MKAKRVTRAKYVTKRISGFSPAEKKRRLVEQKRGSERESAHLGFLSVVAFGHPALREAYRIWWQPFDMGPDFERFCGRGRRHVHLLATEKSAGPEHWIDEVMSGASLEFDKLEPLHKKRMAAAIRRFNKRKAPASVQKRKSLVRYAPKRGKCPVKVKLVIDYPVTTPQITIVTLDRRYPGEIFAHLHDFYRAIYAEDEHRGGKPGPANRTGFSKYLLNRGSGPLIWGHDIADLMVEAVHYYATPKDKDGAEGVFRFWIGS